MPLSQDPYNIKRRERYATDRAFSDRLKAGNLVYKEANRARLRAHVRKTVAADRARIRAAMLVAYGSRCVCCGETEPKFLTLDHSRGDGASHKKALGLRMGGVDLYRQLQRLDWPQELGLQLLCANCHLAKDKFGGCPHATK